jgi:hypothetical protein
MNISPELKKELLDIIASADWYYRITGIHEAVADNAEIEELYVEESDQDNVVAQIVDAVINELGAKDTLIFQIKRIADRLEEICTNDK